ncbi:MAG: dipicolinate synthase subunit B [Oscillospiraceae bacterium]|nr:dipicolinate synthase subunit B [Oscillospiraceae bacterium]MCI7500223.1 dipicolinate synthase subunit B [Oscillospiraceae bacterium]MDD7278116.1 dipicolinate synthase subunit B [Oscillospiraceae bacterium]MDY2863108.1 dipicolinate synthase subunit B [Oscillospiraceae bacterium]
MSEITSLEGIKIGMAMCGSFCTFSKAFEQMIKLKAAGAELTPIMSYHAATLDTRFGTAEENIMTAENICGRGVINTIPLAEPVGPKKMFDLLIVCPCTGNTMAKLAAGITDTPVTMAVKSHLRNGRPVLIAAATNDALSASAKNIGALLNIKNIYFVPFRQDDFVKKPRSAVADFSMIPEAAKAALNGRQLQPILA